MSEHLVGLVNGLRCRGVNPSAGTCDWRKMPYSDENRRGVIARPVLPLQQALETRWTSDMFSVMYVMHDADGAPLERQPRLTKGGLSWVEKMGYSALANVLTAEFDNPGKAPWTEDAQLAHLDAIERHELLRACVWYFTPGGWRAHWKLSRKVRAGIELELQIQALLSALEKIGLSPDWQCVDWTRIQRLPWVERADGKIARQTPWGDGIEIDPFDIGQSAARIGAARASRTKKIRCPEGIDFAQTLEPAWVARAGVISEALREEYAARGGTGWHDAFLCLPGALLDVGVNPSIIVALCAAVAVGASSEAARSGAIHSAQTTVRRAQNGEPIRGKDALQREWPSVWAAVEQVCARGANAPRAVLPSIEEAAVQIQQALRDAPEGVSIIAAGCGVGKTRNTELVAIERAQQARWTKRASPNTRTAISVPTNKLAKQIAQNLEARGARVLRVFSPPSELGPDGAPYCRFHKQAKLLAAGGVSVGFELCRGGGEARRECPDLHDCPAAGGQAGDPDALIVVGNHGLLSSVLGSAGVTGLKVIDEPPALLTTATIDAQCFAMFDALSDALRASSRKVIEQLVAGMRALFESLPEGHIADLSDLVDEEIREIARAVDLRRGPPLRADEAVRARGSEGYARDLGRMCSTAMVTLAALRSTMRVTARIENIDGRAALKITRVNDDVHAALRTEGRTVLLDAAPDLAVLERATGYKLDGRVTRVEARDGAPISRTLLKWSRGARRHLVNEQRKIETGRLKHALRAIFAWLAEDPQCKRVGLITFLPVKTMLAGALRPDGSQERARAEELFGVGCVRDLSEYLCQQYFIWHGVIDLGYYGAVRGLDDWMGCDAIVTLGDPWQNVGDVFNDATYLGEDPRTTGRHEWLARAELEQAQGRMRAPSRTAPARALHVGSLLPLGALWEAPEVRVLADGRPKNDSAMSADDLRAWIDTAHGGSIRAAARALGMSDMAVRRYLDPKGSRAIPGSVAALVRGATESALKGGTSIGTFGRTEMSEAVGQ